MALSSVRERANDVSWPSIPADPPSWWSVFEARVRLDPGAVQIAILVRRHTGDNIPFCYPLPWPVNGVKGQWALAAMDVAEATPEYLDDPQDRLIFQRWS